MERWTITCESCEGTWSLACSFSFYEQQTLESHPCPHCGAYTLTCGEPTGERARGHTMRTLRRGLSAQAEGATRNFVA
jgi:hypothetical protein